jgi:hypothetical protein
VPESVRRPRRVVTTTVAAPPADLEKKEVEFTAPLQAPVASQCRTGVALDANGLVGEAKTEFSARDKIHVSVWLKESPKALVVSTHAIAGADKEIASVSKPANGAKTLTLTLDPLPAGSYKLETYWGGNVVCEEKIEVTSPSRPG